MIERQLEALRWLQDLVAQDPRPGDGVGAWLNPSLAARLERAGVAEIVVKNNDDKPVFTWTLRGVIPVRWQGPSLSVESPKVATETLELAHHGFLPKGATQ